MDKKTPHLHFTFVPLTQDNRLCAKEIIGNCIMERKSDFISKIRYQKETVVVTFQEKNHAGKPLPSVHAGAESEETPGTGAAAL